MFFVDRSKRGPDGSFPIGMSDCLLQCVVGMKVGVP